MIDCSVIDCSITRSCHVLLQCDFSSGLRMPSRCSAERWRRQSVCARRVLQGQRDMGHGRRHRNDRLRPELELVPTSQRPALLHAGSHAVVRLLGPTSGWISRRSRTAQGIRRLRRCRGRGQGPTLHEHRVGDRAPDLGAESVFRPRKRMSSYFLLKWGVQMLYIFNQNQTPRSDSANLEPSEIIFCPQILEPRWETGGPPMMSALNHVSRHPSTSPWSHDGSSGVDVYPHEAQHAYTQLPEVRCVFMQVAARALQSRTARSWYKNHTRFCGIGHF